MQLGLKLPLLIANEHIHQKQEAAVLMLASQVLTAGVRFCGTKVSRSVPLQQSRHSVRLG